MNRRTKLHHVEAFPAPGPPTAQPHIRKSTTESRVAGPAISLTLT